MLSHLRPSDSATWPVTLLPPNGSSTTWPGWVRKRIKKSGNSGGKRDEGADHGQEPAEKDGDAAELLEEVLGAVEVVAAEEDVFAEALDGGPASQGTEPVGMDGAEIAADGSGGGDPEELELTGVHEVAGEGHDDLGGERDAGRFDAHEQRDAGVATSGDYGNDEGGQGGYDFLGHARAVYRGSAVDGMR